jgi:hypothetical protein|tara:strand:- start:2056 stop:2325 length:270 start_codon:yes stop_codon:yes gene_type:complete
MIGKGLSTAIKNIIYTERGRFILAIILGLGLASLFRKFCDGKNCYTFIGPEQNSIRDQIFSFDSNNNECFVMREKSIKCGNKDKSIEFA